MKKKMLIDASHKEIIRVAIIEKNNLIDYESKKLKMKESKEIFI